MRSKALGVPPSYVRQICEELNPVNPAEPQRSRRAPASCKRQAETAHLPPFLPSLRLVLEGFLLLITIPLSWIIPALRSGLWVPAGHDCRHRWESRPVMASICHCALASVCFLYCFSFRLSSWALFFSWKCPIGTKRRCYKGSNVIPINTFQHREGPQSQLKVYILLNGYWNVECYEVKMSTIYSQKANGR